MRTPSLPVLSFFTSKDYYRVLKGSEKNQGRKESLGKGNRHTQ